VVNKHTRYRIEAMTLVTKTPGLHFSINSTLTDFRNLKFLL
jgi:hypothetical protein